MAGAAATMWSSSSSIAMISCGGSSCRPRLKGHPTMNQGRKKKKSSPSLRLSSCGKDTTFSKDRFMIRSFCSSSSSLHMFQPRTSSSSSHTWMGMGGAAAVLDHHCRTGKKKPSCCRDEDEEAEEDPTYFSFLDKKCMPWLMLAPASSTHGYEISIFRRAACYDSPLAVKVFTKECLEPHYTKDTVCFASIEGWLGFMHPQADGGCCLSIVDPFYGPPPYLPPHIFCRFVIGHELLLSSPPHSSDSYHSSSCCSLIQALNEGRVTVCDQRRTTISYDYTSHLPLMNTILRQRHKQASTWRQQHPDQYCINQVGSTRLF